jgi:hypothetical protein
MAFVAVTTPIVLPWPLQSSLEAMARVLLEPGDRSQIDFSRPVGEAALLSPESVSWRVFKNPLSLFIGGVTADYSGRSCSTASAHRSGMASLESAGRDRRTTRGRHSP